jgi:hypothetical protein
MIKKILGMAGLVWGVAHANVLSVHGTGPLFKTTLNGSTLTVSTTKPAWFYQFAGIKLLSSGYSIQGTTNPAGNGYYLFPVSDTQPASFTLSSIPSGPVKVRLCLNGIGQTAGCEEQTASAGGTPGAFPQLTSFRPNVDDAGVGLGSNFVPGLGAAGPNTEVVVIGFPLLMPSSTCNTAAALPSTEEVDLSSNLIVVTPNGFPFPCIAFCKAPFTPPYLGQSASCTNVVQVTT